MNLLKRLFLMLIFPVLVTGMFSCKKKSAIIPVVPPVDLIIETPNSVPDLPF